MRITWLSLLCMLAAAATVGAEDALYRQQVEDDWTAQEQRLQRRPDQPEAIRHVLDRAGQLVEDAQSWSNGPRLDQEKEALASLRKQVEAVQSLGRESRLALYRQARWMARELALQNPLLAGKPLLFMKRHRFVCQMLHEYLGYFYDYGDIAGGGVFVLENPGHSLATRELIQGRLPRGNYTTLALSFDQRTIYFAFAERAAEKPDFYSPERRSFHLFAMASDGGQLRQLTYGVEDDFDPCPLPEGGLVFVSSRRGGFGRCHNPWEPLPTYTLHRLDADGQEVVTLSFHETNEWHPSVMNDGRILYTRWDYVDRSAANFHGLWLTHPDGSNPVSLFGNYTTRINACYQARAIPGSRRVLFVAGAHHADVGGSLVLVDPDRVALDRQSGEDDFGAVEVLTPEVCFPEAPDWPKSYFHSPWPLSENCFLVAFSLDPLPGMGPGEKRDTKTGLYYLDRFGNLELLYRDAASSCMYPIPLVARPIPPRIARALDPQLGSEGEFVLVDVRRSLMPLPAARPVRELRVFQVLPKTTNHVANQPRIGYANAESARFLLGTVPVEDDGSAYFRAPAGKPLYFQAVDAQGRAVHTMRSVTYLQPGERRSCLGCHEPPGTVPASAAKPPQAVLRPPSAIELGPDGSQPLSFPRLVQPVLDRHCVRCHDGSEGSGKSLLALTGGRTDPFTKAYGNLKPYVRWHEWGGQSISQIATRPGHNGADESPLSAILDDPTHAPEVKMPDADRRRLYLWLDANAPFYGTYSRDEQLAQQKGEAVALPLAQ